MNLKPKDKKFENNLILLSACAKIQEIVIKAENSERKEYLKYLESNEGLDFRSFLVSTINRLSELENISPPQINSTEDLLNFLPHTDMIPERYLEDYSRHKSAYKIQSNYPYKDLQLEEFKKLQSIIKEIQNNADNSQYDSSDLLKYMSNPNHTRIFQNFSNTMLTSNPAVINRKYSHLAKTIAKRHDLYTEAFSEKLSDTLKKPKLILTIDSLARTCNTAKKLIPALALSSSLLLGIHEYKEHAEKKLPQPEITHETNDIIDNNISTENIGPISQTPSLESYEDACKDFLTKTSEVYKYNTGKDIDLSNYGQENIESSPTLIYVVNYNGQTYRFSAQSPYRTNARYLKEALEASGATIVEEVSSNISYIHDEKQSIAIVDSNGNPIKSGNIMERANSGGLEMFNQTYVNAANEMLLKQGINTTNMSESELVGRYILSSEYNIQNTDLSIALGETSKSLLYHIENSFWKDNGKSDDAYAIYLYEQESRKFEENFNEKSKTKTEYSASTNNNSKTDISDDFDYRH